MRDPFPIAPPAPLVAAVKPLADRLSLSTLPLHAHEVIFAFCLYTFIHNVVGPFLSNLFVGERYSKFNARTKTNWNVHVVSFFQSCIICTISLYIIFYDEERQNWKGKDRWDVRIWGYSGLTGLCQSFALGYFLWDFVMCAWRVDIFGWGMLAHAISAVSVFSLGYRPFVYFYCPVFLLYELSSPFLNIHWFCDKLDLTGSVYQAVNGAFLTTTFFLCRICWGTYSSYNTFTDMYSAYAAGHAVRVGTLGDVGEIQSKSSGDISLYYDEAAQEQAFMGDRYLPLWLPAIYLASNLVLNALNFWWFSKMISTIRSRFPSPWGTKGVRPESRHWEPQERPKAGKVADGFKTEIVDVQKGVDADGHKSVEVTGTTRRSARSRRKA